MTPTDRTEKHIGGFRTETEPLADDGRAPSLWPAGETLPRFTEATRRSLGVSVCPFCFDQCVEVHVGVVVRLAVGECDPPFRGDFVQA